MSDDTSRRERAIKLVESMGYAVWKRDDQVRNDISEFRCGGEMSMEAARLAAFHLAGAREEAAINAAEITDLRQEVGNLQRAIRWYHGYDEPGTSSFPLCLDGPRCGWRSVARSEFPCVRRALEAKS